MLHKKARGSDADLSLSTLPLFSRLSFSLQILQFFFNILAEFYLAFQDTAGPARDTIRVKLHAVFSIKIKIFAGKCHSAVRSHFLKDNFPKIFRAFFINAGLDSICAILDQDRNAIGFPIRHLFAVSLTKCFTMRGTEKIPAFRGILIHLFF